LKKNLAWVAVAAAVLGTGTAQAQNIVLTDELNQVTLKGGVGVLAIESREYVFQAPGSSNLLSLLIWQTTAPLLTASLDIQLPSNWTFGVSANVAGGGDSYMEDYDWMVPKPGIPDMSNWSHQSKHPNTTLDRYFHGSARVGYDIYKEAGTRLNLYAGLEYTDVQWTGSDGTFIYSSSGGFRDITGHLIGRVITYRQQFPALLAGVNSTFEVDDWTLSLGAKAGFTFANKAIDNHWMRNLRFDEKVTASPILGANASAEYALGDNINVFVSGEVDRIFLGRSDTSTYDATTGTHTGTVSKNASGADLLSGAFKIGLTGRF
jgi:outer membrane protease